jgi:hypothetical protein
MYMGKTAMVPVQAASSWHRSCCRHAAQQHHADHMINALKSTASAQCTLEYLPVGHIIRAVSAQYVMLELASDSVIVQSSIKHMVAKDSL